MDWKRDTVKLVANIIVSANALTLGTTESMKTVCANHTFSAIAAHSGFVGTPTTEAKPDGGDKLFA